MSIPRSPSPYYSRSRSPGYRRDGPDADGPDAQEQSGGDDVGITAHDIDDFVTKFPCDETALDYLQKSSPEVQELVIREFNPRNNEHHSDKKDFSALLTRFIQSVTHRFGKSGKGESKGGKSWRTARSRSPRRDS